MHVIYDDTPGQFLTDQSAAIEATREKLVEGASHAVEIWERYVPESERAVRAQQEAILEADRQQARRVQSLRVKTAEFDRDEAHHHGATEAQKKKRALWGTMLERELKKSRETQNRPPFQMPFGTDKLDTWAAKEAGCFAYKPKITKVPTGEKALKELDATRARRSDLLQERKAVENAPLTADEALAKAIHDIDEVAKKSEPRVAALFRMRKNFAGAWEQCGLDWAKVIKPGTHDTFVPDAFGTFVWLHRDLLVKRISAMIQKHGAAHGLTRDERGPAIAEIDKKLLELEYKEAALILALEKSGNFNVPRRHDMSPEAVLQIVRA